jgi:Fe-S cluster assembly protein SufD
MTDIDRANLFLSRMIDRHSASVSSTEHPLLLEQRREAAARFRQQGVSSTEDERWRNFEWETITRNTYQFPVPPQQYLSVRDFFTCSAQGLDTFQFILLNGWDLYKEDALTTFPNGVVIGSMKAAWFKHQALICDTLSTCRGTNVTGWDALSQSLWQDGLFVYVPDHTVFDQAVQLVNLLQTEHNLFVNTRHLVILGKHASLKLIHCVETLRSNNLLLNGWMDIVLDEGAALDYLKLENNDKSSVLLSQTTVYQNADSVLNTHVNTLNNGRVHSSIDVHLQQPRARAHCHGLYLLDTNQSVSHCVSVYHHAPSCQSSQNYNGILDDEAKAEFISKVYVAPDAQQTQSKQLNRNILLTDAATVKSRPFLEIYADDVKCNHGATIGQMDQDAIFYLKSRGVCEKNAKKLLLHAFAKEIIDRIAIAPLVAYSDEFVRKRLSGESTTCTNCIVCCGESVRFEVQMPEI